MDPALERLEQDVRAFVNEVLLPLEPAMLADPHGVRDPHRAELHLAARQAGVFAPHVAIEWGGLGLDLRGQAVILEAAGYSLLGPHALNCAAPDEGNMHLLHRVATDAQQRSYLAPLAAGETRSCFAMTEPPPGAGADPSLLQTTARPCDGGWMIDGVKWFITGAAGAAFAICMARTPDAGPDAATMFLVDADNPGWRVVRAHDTLDAAFAGGHFEVCFDRCVVPEEAVLGEVGEGMAYAQVRLGPARLTHCMRWLGMAQRAQDIALDVVRDRHLFGARLGDLGLAQQLLADNEIDLAACRALVAHTAGVLDRGERAGMETSVAKVFVSEAVNRVVDRAVQLAGARGISAELPLSRIWKEVRPFRIYDGPSETHRWSIARRALRRSETTRGDRT